MLRISLNFFCRFVCHSLCFSRDDSLTTQCINTTQTYLHKNLHPKLVFIAIYSLQRCCKNTLQNKNTIDLCNALTVALINTTPFDRANKQPNAILNNTIEASLSAFRNDNKTFLAKSLELLQSLQNNTIQQVLESEVPYLNKVNFDEQIQQSHVFVNAFGSKAVGLPRNVRSACCVNFVFMNILLDSMN